MSFFDWTPDDLPALVLDMDEAGAWERLIARYSGGRGNLALERVVEIAKLHGVVSVLEERRYIDQDWRSEHSRFYSTTFVRYPSVCHRLHFFQAPLPTDLGDLSKVAGAYVGYSVMRPLPSSPVGRTMLKPPPELSGAVRCEGAEVVDVLGWPMSVTAMPFVSQDAQYMRCAHADLWMTLYLAHLRQGLPRRLPAEIHAATSGGVVVGRQVPSEGLSVHQMLSGMATLGLSPGLLDLPATSQAEATAGGLSLYQVVCRYINSNLPPIISSKTHVWLVVAYSRDASAGNARLTLYRHDDARGPYLKVEDPWNEPYASHQPWTAAILPLPPKIYMTAERAEYIGRLWFEQRLKGVTPGDPLHDADSAGALTFLTYGIKGTDYKHGLVQRTGLSPEVARAYRLSVWPRNLWVIEAIDRRLRDSGAPCVLGEVLIDPTANHYPDAAEPGILVVHAPHLMVSVAVDHPSTGAVSTTVGDTAYASGRPTL